MSSYHIVTKTITSTRLAFFVDPSIIDSISETDKANLIGTLQIGHDEILIRTVFNSRS